MTMTEGQLTLRSLVQGCGTAYELVVAHIGGLGLPDVIATDVPDADRDGDVAGFDRYARRLLTFPILLKAADSTRGLADRQAEVHALVRPFKQAWVKAPTADVPLVLHLADMWGTSVDEATFFGRPRPVTFDMGDQWRGFIHATAQFVCADPVAYGALVSLSDSSTPAGFTVDGDVESYRFTITVHGNGGTPQLTATTDAGRVMLFNATLAGGATAVLDFLTQTVTIAGVPVYPLATDEWFRLLPGVNSIAFTGCASLDIAYRPAFV